MRQKQRERHPVVERGFALEAKLRVVAVYVVALLFAACMFKSYAGGAGASASTELCCGPVRGFLGTATATTSSGGILTLTGPPAIHPPAGGWKLSPSTVTP